jgi:serine/threonine-protein kinase
MLLLTLGAAGVLVYLGLWRWHLLEAHGAAGTLPPSATAAAPPAVHPLPDTLTADEPRGETGRAQALPHAAQPSRPRVAAPNARVTSVASASVEPSVHGEPPTHEAAPTAGFLTIDTTPWSIVSVGGKSLGQTPLVGVKLPAGAQTLSLRNPELGIETQYPVTIEPGKTLVRRVGLE